MFFHDVLNEALMLPATVPTIQEFPQRYEELMTVDPKTGKRYIDIHFEVGCSCMLANVRYILICSSLKP